MPRTAALATLLLAAAARAAEPEESRTALPADPGEEIVVTATRGPRPRRDVPAAVSVVTREEIERSPSKAADELLRAEPSFNLFRRSSSLAADPSSQGVKLRNVGGSGISRALVLVDGVPVNDGFASWVPWRSIPALGLDRVEVVPGGGSALYGNYALGGVIQALSRPIEPMDADVLLEGGSFGTARAALRAADRRGRTGMVLEGDFLSSEGYRVVAPAGRGPVDQATPSTHVNARVRAEVEASPELRLDLRGSLFHEALNGGTRYTTAMERRFEYAGNARWAPGGGGSFEASLFGHHGDFRQDRARVPPPPAPRSSESLNAHQIVPSDDAGGSLVWRSRPLAGALSLTAGADVRWIRGTTLEDLFPAAATVTDATVLERDARGEQRLYGLFAQGIYDLGRATASAAVRYDRWENRAGWRRERTRVGEAISTFPDRSGGELSPKVGVTVRLAEWLGARAAAYRSFRAPTLDELYRPFQVGTVRTLSNEGLTPERLQGFEVGLDLRRLQGFTGRATGFWNELRDPILNVTTGTNLRQRQNLGKARIQGLEAEVGWSWRWLRANAAWTLAEAQITSAPGQEALVGKALPHTPKHQGTISLAYDDPRRATASAQARYVGKQYETETNAATTVMGEFVLVDLFAAWHATDRFDLFLAVENLFDKTYLVGRAGVDTIGQPRFVHAGLRAQLGR